MAEKVNISQKDLIEAFPNGLNATAQKMLKEGGFTHIGGKPIDGVYKAYQDLLNKGSTTATPSEKVNISQQDVIEAFPNGLNETAQKMLKEGGFTHIGGKPIDGVYKAYQRLVKDSGREVNAGTSTPFFSNGGAATSTPFINTPAATSTPFSSLPAATSTPLVGDEANVNGLAQDWFNKSISSAEVNSDINYDSWYANDIRPYSANPNRPAGVNSVPPFTGRPFSYDEYSKNRSAATSTPSGLPVQSTQAATSTPSGLPAINNPPLSAKYREAQAQVDQQSTPVPAPQGRLSMGDQITSWMVDDDMTSGEASTRWLKEHPDTFNVQSNSSTVNQNQDAYSAIVDSVVDNGIQADQAAKNYADQYRLANNVPAVPATVASAPASVSVPARSIPTPNQVAYPQTDNDFAAAQAGQRVQLPVQQPQTMWGRFQQAIAAQPQRQFSDPYDPTAAPLNYRSARR